MPKVWYTGVGSRTITSADWLERGITASDVSWNTSNAWAVDHTVLNTAQLNVLAGDKDFLLNQEGPRAWPRPVSPVEEHQSGYVYYARLLQIYDALIELGGSVITRLPPYIRFSSAIAQLGVTATDRAYEARTLTGARMRVSSAPQGSALTAVIQSFDGFSWEDIGTVSIPDGSVVEAVTTFSKVQGVSNLLRAEITSVGSTSAATGVAIDVLVSTSSGTLSGDESDLIDVQDYGATGNGFTDDLEAIKLAQSAMENGKCMYFPPGNYRVGSVPEDEAAVVLNGLSNVGVIFDPGATIWMDNLEDGLSTSTGISIHGLAEHITIINPTIKWTVRPEERGGHSNGIRAFGYPSDSGPAEGWLGSSGKISYLTIVNPTVHDSGEAGVLLYGCSDVAVYGSNMIDTLADGLHFNACRRITVNGHHAHNVEDDGLAFVCYYHATEKWEDPYIGPFWQSELDEWCNSGAATGVSASGERANGFRVQMGRDLAIGDVHVSDKDFGFTLNSAVIGVGNDWQSLASRNVTIDNITVSDCESGVVLATNLIDEDDDEKWWNFDGCKISNVTIRNSGNWSFVVEQPDNYKSIFSGVDITNIVAIAGDNTPGEEHGGHGGVRLTGLKNSRVDGVTLISDHGTADIVLTGSAQRYGFVEGVEDVPTPVLAYPQSALAVDHLVVRGGGRVLIQDVAGLSIGRIDSYECTGVAVVLLRTLDVGISTINVRNPGRTEDLGRGVQINQSYNVDINEVIINTDDHEPETLWQALEIGGGDEDNPGGSGIRIEKLTYTSDFDKTASEVAYQTGSYAPTDWYVQAHWLHKGESSPIWRSRRYGDQITELNPVNWINGPLDFDDLKQGGIFYVAGEFLNGAANPTYNTPGSTGLLKLTVTVADPDDLQTPLVVLQEFISVDPLASTQSGSRVFTEGYTTGSWSSWVTNGV